MPPRPGEHKPLWNELSEYITEQSVKGHTVILAGDLNVSLNTPYTRKTVGRQHDTQHEILEEVCNSNNLLDAFQTRHGKETIYKTWRNNHTWTSTDHILIPQGISHRILAVQNDHQPIISYNLDHSTLSLALSMDENIKPIPQGDHRKIFLDPKKVEKDYAPAVKARLLEESAKHPQMQATTKAQTLFKIAIDTAESVFGTKGHKTHKNYKVLKLWNDIKHLNKAQHHLQQGEPIPQSTLNKKIIQATGTTLPKIQNKKRNLKKQINSKARKRATITRRMFNKARTDKFNQGRYGAFLTSALGKFSHFKGVQGFFNLITGGISTDPAQTRDIATRRIRDTFFKERIKTPEFFQHRTEENWAKLPQWFQTQFHNIQDAQVNPRYAHILDPISIQGLRTGINKMGANKTGGPSGLTVEMLKYLPDETLEEWLLPFINHALTTGDIPSDMKKFNVWCTEKTPGVGTIMHPTEKLQVRPISLFEVSAKIIEGQITYRLNKVLQKDNHMSIFQYGFTWGKSVVDALLMYTLLFEHAEQHKQEIHISNNDCTQAYDAVPTWGMEAIYSYHGFPPKLSTFLINLDSNRVGQVLTAHGAGDEWTKTCGLGQGSIISPLKWNLFLDPLLKRLTTTKDPFIMGRVPIHVIAFADDTTIVSSTHEGYKIRMNMANDYFSMFGVEFSPAKTKYTYNNTDIKWTPVKIKLRKSDGSYIYQKTAVVEPTEAIRYLGGWMTLSNNWKTAKQRITEDLKKIIRSLKHKRLGWKEYRYVVRSVISAKMRYYLTIVPMTDHQLREFDIQVAGLMKKELRMAKSSSTPLLYMNHKESMGLSLPSIRDIRDQTMITKLHMILNTDNILSRMGHRRLHALQEELKWTTIPTAYPHRCPQTIRKWWMGRAILALKRLRCTIPDDIGAFATTPGRKEDTPLFLVLPPIIFNSLLPHLREHNITWVSDIASASGTKIKHSDTPFTRTTWWQTLKEATCEPGSNTLKQPVANITASLQTETYRNRIGDIVTIPKEIALPGTLGNTYHPQEHNGMYQITKVFRKKGREVCELTELHETFRNVQQVKVDNTWRKVTSQGPSHFQKGDSRAQVLPHEYANSVMPVPHKWVHTKSSRTEGYIEELGLLIRDHQFFETSSARKQGPLDPTQLQTMNNEFKTRFYVNEEDGLVYSHTEDDDIGECDICSHTGHLIYCDSHVACTGMSHLQCAGLRHTPPGTWSCKKCTKKEEEEFTAQWKPTDKETLDQLDQTSLYSGSDGSVKKIKKMPSSAYGVAITDNKGKQLVYSGKIQIRPKEASSLRVELEALIAAYYLIPSHLQPIHAVDNLEAVLIHHRLKYNAYNRERYINTAYRGTIRRLSKAMEDRGTFLNVIHTHSHLEHLTTEDTDLNHRRQILALADKAADKGHYRSPDPIHKLNDPYPLQMGEWKTEKAVINILKEQCFNLWEEELQLRTMEGSNQRTAPIPKWDLQLSTWQDHLVRFRNKLWTQRIPTNETRAQRKDQVNGTHIQRWCQICKIHNKDEVETQLHLLHTCPHAQARKDLLHRKINLLFSQYRTLPENHRNIGDTLNNLLNQTTLDETLVLTEGWRSSNKDKLGRESLVKRGPPRITYKRYSWNHTWIKNILEKNPHQSWESIEEILPPVETSDPFLLKELAGVLKCTHIIEPIRFNPFVESIQYDQYLEITEDPVKHHCLLDLTSTDNLDHIIIRENTKNNRIRERRSTIMLTQEQMKRYNAHLGNWNILITIPKDTMSIYPARYWKGIAPHYHKADRNKQEVLVLTSFNSKECLPLAKSVIYSRNMQADTTEQRILHQQTLEAIPTNVKNLLTSSNTSPETQQLLSGGISTHLIQTFGTWGIPEYNIQPLYRGLHRSIVTHQWETWLSRNGQVHPPTHSRTSHTRTSIPTHTPLTINRANINPTQPSTTTQHHSTPTQVIPPTHLPTTTHKRKRQTQDSTQRTITSHFHTHHILSRVHATTPAAVTDTPLGAEPTSHTTASSTHGTTSTPPGRSLNSPAPLPHPNPSHTHTKKRTLTPPDTEQLITKRTRVQRRTGKRKTPQELADSNQVSKRPRVTPPPTRKRQLDLFGNRTVEPLRKKQRQTAARTLSEGQVEQERISILSTEHSSDPPIAK